MEAKGFKVLRVSPPGKDMGVDIIAGSGELGLDRPRVVVQVKSGEATIGRKEIQQFEAVITNSRADYGLFISWGGFTRDAENYAKEKPFKIRLWTSQDLLKELLENYEGLSESWRARLPLKKVWVLDAEALEGL